MGSRVTLRNSRATSARPPQLRKFAELPLKGTTSAALRQGAVWTAAGPSRQQGYGRFAGATPQPPLCRSPDVVAGARP